MAKLKVFRTPTGFHDAYVAAPSRKAALAAWGAEADLFARGTAEEVTDARQALVNPLGLYVTNLTWGEVVSTASSSDQQSNSTQSGNAQKPSAQSLNGGQNQ